MQMKSVSSVAIRSHLMFFDTRNSIMIIKFAAIIIRNGKILLVRKKETNIFISPGGKPDFGEAAEDCLRREIHEEIGVTLHNAVRFRTDYSVSAFEQEPIKIVSYLVEVNGEPVPSSEIEELRWVSFEDIDNLHVGSIFRDAVIPALKAGNLIE